MTNHLATTKYQVAQEYDAYYMRHMRQLWRRKRTLAAGCGLSYGEWEPVHCAVWVKQTGDVIDLDFLVENVALDEDYVYQLRPLPD